MDDADDFLPSFDSTGAADLFGKDEELEGNNVVTEQHNDEDGLLPGEDENRGDEFGDSTVRRGIQVADPHSVVSKLNSRGGRGSKAREKKKKAEEKAASSNTEFSKVVERMKQARKKKRITDEESTDRVETLLQKMRDAAEMDVEKLANDQPATCKLALVDIVTAEVAKPVMANKYMRSGFFGVVENWLAPLPDHSLPNLTLRTKILGLIARLNFSAESLGGSALGERLVELWKSSEETEENRDNIRKIVNNLSKPILGLRFNAGFTPSAAPFFGPSPSPAESSFSAGGSLESSYRASLPRVRARTFTVAPKGQATSTRQNAETRGVEDDRLQRLIDQKIRKPKNKPTRSSHVSISKGVY